ncbi:MAG: hypothetical protein OEV78_07220 [Spirochaetia bacterium]|nr:hypothetical protein [Spirochaetia bacterium]
MKIKNFVLPALGIVYISMNNALWACSSCNVLYSFSKEKIDAYFDTTILMGILPVSFMALLVFLVYKTSKSTNN